MSRRKVVGVSTAKRKLNLTIRPEVRLKLDQLAEIDNRSVSNLIEVMANERWSRMSKAIGSR